MNNETQHTAEKDLLELIEGNIASCNNFECSVIDCDRMNVELIKKYSQGIAPSLLKENQELKEQLLSETGKAMRYSQTIEDQKSINEELIKALEGLAAYFKYMVKDPQFKEYRDAMEILSKSKTEKP